MLAAFGCAHPKASAPSRGLVHMEELRITAAAQPDGSYRFRAYNAENLFKQGLYWDDRKRYDEAIAWYDRVVAEFGSSRFASPALYNSALCAQRLGQREQALERFQRLLETMPNSPDLRHAHFRIVELSAELGRWQVAREHADVLLSREDLSPEERLEALGQGAHASLQLDQVSEAAAQAADALQYYRLRSARGEIANTYFAAQANFTLAETHRLRSERIALRGGSIDEQRPLLEERSQWLLRAQREYFNTIRWNHAPWSSPSGYRIGQLYAHFFDAIVESTPPPPRDSAAQRHPEEYAKHYRIEVARLVRPLLRHSIRFWELALMMVERIDSRSSWVERIRLDLDRVRARLAQELSLDGERES